jgi:ATP-dependent DNA helicase DinG
MRRSCGDTSANHLVFPQNAYRYASNPRLGTTVDVFMDAAANSSRIEKALARVTTNLPNGGETRTGQVTMANAVHASIRSKRHLVVEAGTGTGKSLGYLVPAIAAGAKVVVSTATKALQDQLASKDLPFLHDHLGIDFTYALLKGRSNYFCKQKAAEFTGNDAQMGLEGMGDDDGWASTTKNKEKIRDEVVKLMDWADKTSIGDRAELSFEPTPAAWSAVSVAAGECPGAAKCPVGEACFAEKARAMASTSDIIVVNTHLYGQHVRAGGHILPEHDVVVFDEAHEVEDIIADSLGLEISAGRFTFLVGRMRQILTDFEKSVDLIDAGTQLERALTPFAGERLLKGPAAVEPIRVALTTGITRVNKALELLKVVADDATGGAGQRKIRAVQAATQLIDDLVTASELGTASEVDTADERVAWVEAESKTRGPVLRIAPIEVGGSLAKSIWADTTAIFTSATIPTNLGARLGLAADNTVSIKVESPFDYQTQGLLYCAVHLPDPRQPGFEAASHKELERLLRAAGGRTLALFTSWKGMTAAAEAMRALKPALPFRILTQSDLPKPALTKAFAEDETSVLFATMGFWQGIDVPGRALSLVIIDKLPFSRPDEPLLVARREKVGDAAFRLIDLPRAAMMLAQGCGRLIRTSSDHGVVAVLDSRLNTARSYRGDLLAALPPMKRTRNFNEVAAFLTKITS